MHSALTKDIAELLKTDMLELKCVLKKCTLEKVTLNDSAEWRANKPSNCSKD